MASGGRIASAVDVRSRRVGAAAELYLLTSPRPGTAEEAAVLGRAVPRILPVFLELDLQHHQAAGRCCGPC